MDHASIRASSVSKWAMFGMGMWIDGIPWLSVYVSIYTYPIPSGSLTSLKTGTAVLLVQSFMKGGPVQ